jgi:hypothetical protein
VLVRYEEEGGEHDLVRRSVSGRPRKLAQLHREALRSLVLAPASQYGYETDFWTTRRLIQVIHAEFDVSFAVRKGTRIAVLGLPVQRLRGDRLRCELQRVCSSRGWSQGTSIPAARQSASVAG